MVVGAQSHQWVRVCLSGLGVVLGWKALVDQLAVAHGLSGVLAQGRGFDRFFGASQPWSGVQAHSDVPFEWLLLVAASGAKCHSAELHSCMHAMQRAAVSA